MEFGCPILQLDKRKQTWIPWAWTSPCCHFFHENLQFIINSPKLCHWSPRILAWTSPVWFMKHGFVWFVMVCHGLSESRVPLDPLVHHRYLIFPHIIPDFTICCHIFPYFSHLFWGVPRHTARRKWPSKVGRRRVSSVCSPWWRSKVAPATGAGPGRSLVWKFPRGDRSNQFMGI